MEGESKTGASLDRAERTSRLGCIAGSLVVLIILVGLSSFTASSVVDARGKEAEEVLQELQAEGLSARIEDLDGPPAPQDDVDALWRCLLYTSPSPRDATLSRMPSSA